MTTRHNPPRARAGNWKHKLFPPPVGIKARVCSPRHNPSTGPAWWGGAPQPSAREATGPASRGEGKFLGCTCGEDSWVADFWALNVKCKSDEERRSRKLESNKLRDEASGWMDGMTSWLATNRGVDVMVAVPAPYLAWCTGQARWPLCLGPKRQCRRLWGIPENTRQAC